MNKKEVQIYLCGLFDIASSVSEWMGPSYAEPYVFDNAGRAAELNGFFGFGITAFEETKCNFTEYLSELYGGDKDKKLRSSLEYHITKELGAPKEFMLLKEEYYGKLENKKSPVPFYTVETAALVKFREYTVVFVTGNNE